MMTPHPRSDRPGDQDGRGAARAVRKRWRVVRARPGQLLARYGRADSYDDPDVIYAWPDRDGKPDTRVLMRAFEEAPVYDGKTLRQELEARGYDITTLRFSIDRMSPTPTGEDGAVPHLTTEQE